jgi:hypothetical protein
MQSEYGLRNIVFLVAVVAAICVVAALFILGS